MGKKEENVGFICKNCRNAVFPLQNGGYRNHCPFCLASLHLDEHVPGDRKSCCIGIMKASAVRFSGKKGWQIAHTCQNCRIERANKIAEGDVQSGDWTAIIELTSQEYQ